MTADRDATTPAGALAGVRVLDLTDASGVFATRLLADLGADVVRVEPPDGGALRATAPFLGGVAGVERGYCHLYQNAGKRSLLLDARTDAGRAHLDRLVSSADVVVESGNPGGDAPFDAQASVRRLRAMAPHLVHVTVTPYGADGPRSGWRGNDLTAAAAAGLLHTSGGPEDPPMQGNGSPAWRMAGLVAATGTLVALHRARAGGGGAHVDVSVQESMLMAAVQQLNPCLYTLQRRVPRRSGLYGPLHRCADGRWVALRPNGAADGARFLDWARQQGLAGDDDTPASAIRKVVAARPAREVLECGWRCDMIALPVGRFADMPGEPHFQATGQFFTIARDAGDVAPGEPTALGFVRSPVAGMASAQPLRRAPRLGEHTAELLAAAPRPAPAGIAASQPGATPALPLAGIRVLDFTWVLAGPFGTRVLANFGAEVIRIESAARPDSTRGGGSQGGRGPNAGALFNDANAGKRSLTLDLTRPEARDIVERLVAVSDVVANNFRPGVMERMGFGHAALARINPGIVHVSLPGCGNVGPWSERGTFGGVLMAASGLNEISGFPGRPPYGIGCAFPDFTSPYLLAMTTLAALHERARTGRGQAITVDQLSATIALLGEQWMRHCAEGGVPRNANRDPNFAPHGVYPCAGEDQWCAIAVDADAQWRALAALMGQPELAVDLRFATHAARLAHHDALDAALAAWTATQDRFALAEHLQAAGIAAAAVADLSDLIERDPQLAHRGHYQKVRQPSDPDLELTIDGEAIRLDGTTRQLARAPMLGEHTRSLLGDLLGMDTATLDRLTASGVIR
jgi:crotonobetainyl-CoA:carnitine CoA-transferase CaiB-like acyl-CoA transferase